MHKKPKWRQIFEKIKPDIALAMVDNVRESAIAAADAQPNNVGAIGALAKVTHITAKAFDPPTWSERPHDAPPTVLVVRTNLNFDVGEPTSLEDARRDTMRTLEMRVPEE